MNIYLAITIVTMSTALIGYMARLLFASKCSNFSCGWGFLHVDRSTLEESKDIEMPNINTHSTHVNNI